MKFAATVLCLALILSAGAPAFAQRGPGVNPPGTGPIPKGKSGPVDDVLGAAGWGDCIAPFDSDYWCSSKSTFSANPKPQKPVK